jgi:uncharacterized protein
MDFLHDIATNLSHPPMLAFVLGLLAVALKSDLEIPPQIAKFLSLYLLFHIGVKGGLELANSGFADGGLKVLMVCALISFVTPWLFFQILKLRLNIYDAATVAACYGSISAVNFIAGTAFLDANNISYSGYMVASMALMESPAVIAGLMIIGVILKSREKRKEEPEKKSKFGFRKIIHEALFNGSVFLLVGSMFIGYFTGANGEAELKPFIDDIFQGMLSFYMLDMGLIAAQRIKGIKGNILFLGSFALFYPIVSSVFAIFIAKFIGLSIGNAFLFTVLVTSSSFIAVPAAMRLAVPKANMGVALPMSLGITFVFNIIFGAPLYLPMIKYVWGL